jgi:ribonuclease HII
MNYDPEAETPVRTYAEEAKSTAVSQSFKTVYAIAISAIEHAYLSGAENAKATLNAQLGKLVKQCDDEADSRIVAAGNAACLATSQRDSLLRELRKIKDTAKAADEELSQTRKALAHSEALRRKASERAAELAALVETLRNDGR